ESNGQQSPEIPRRRPAEQAKQSAKRTRWEVRGDRVDDSGTDRCRTACIPRGGYVAGCSPTLGAAHRKPHPNLIRRARRPGNSSIRLVLIVEPVWAYGTSVPLV